MQAGWRSLTVVLMLSVVALAASASTASQKAAQIPLVLERTIPLPGVGGRIDHLAIDLKRRRLFVAELGNGSVDSIDLGQGTIIRRVAGLKEPQGVAYLADHDELAVASGGDGTVRFYRGDHLAPFDVLRVGDDADALRIEPQSGRLVVGYGAGALAFLDPATHQIIETLSLPGHPESFQFDGDHVFVNVPDAGAVVVGGLDAGWITATWQARYQRNYPLALDAAAGTLAVGYRLPARLVILETRSGAVRADIGICGDADDLFFDAKRRWYYISCGSGAVDVIDAQRYRLVERVATRTGARTALFVPELDRLLVAARAGSSGSAAAILVFRPQP